jgi:hypothetical protein
MHLNAIDILAIEDTVDAYQHLTQLVALIVA